MALTIDLEAGLRPPPPPERGTPDGRLVFRRQLGQGAEGKVFVAVPTRRLQQQQQQQQQSLLGPTSSSASDGGVAQSCPRRQQPRRQVAVKVMSGQAYERCRATRSLWPGLVHPYIVFPRNKESCFDDANGRCFVEMELCETDLLDMVIRRGALRDSRASVFAGQLASALQHLHGQGIAHRDVKLENVFVRDGAAKLGDLGSIAQVRPPTAVPASCQHDEEHHDEHDHKHIDEAAAAAAAAAAATAASSSSSSKVTCLFVGSAMYAPPEAVRRGRGSSGGGAAAAASGNSSAGARQGRSSSSSSSCGAASRPALYSRHDPFAGDIWALGVTLWSAKARSHPWEVACVERSKEFRRFVRKGAEAVFPDNFSPGFRSLLSRLLSLDPLERPTASEILATPWVTAPAPPPAKTQSLQQAPQQQAPHETARQQERQQQALPGTLLSPEGSTGSISGQASCWLSTCEASPGRRQPAPVTPTGPESVGLDAGRFDRGYSRDGVASPSCKVGVKGNVKVEEEEEEMEAGLGGGGIDVSPIPVKIGHHHNQNRGHNPHRNYHRRYEHGLLTVTAPVVPRGEKRRPSPPPPPTPTVGACGDGFDASPPAIETFSPEMNALGGILDGSSSSSSGSSSSGNMDSGLGDGEIMEYGRKAANIARVTPSPLTLPEAAESVEAGEGASGGGGGGGAGADREKVLGFVEEASPQGGATRTLKRPVPAGSPDYCGGEKEVEFLSQQLQLQLRQHPDESEEHGRKTSACKKAKSRLDGGVGCSVARPAADVTAVVPCARISFTLGERGE